MDFQNELNEQQYLAVTHQEGPLLILAGAGSGKTRVLTYRIAYLIEECGVPPRHILAITFTNKAAREMRERAGRIMDGYTAGMWIQTFHAACGRILRAHAEAIGFTSSFIVYDEAEVMTVIKDCMKRLNVDEKRIPPKTMRAVISQAKDDMLSPEEYKNSVEVTDYVYRKYAEIYQMYQDTLKNSNAMDFDDMILMTIRLFQENPDILEDYQERFRYIMVDEYQDTNRSQYLFVTMLARKYRNLCVVGDDDQSIYSFRGADIRNILGFEKEYPECRVIKLEQNYRSTQNILDAANGVIRNNNTRKAKALWTNKGKGEAILRYAGEDQNEEAYFVANEIRKGVECDQMRYADFAILYRINALSQSPESALMRMNIPYKVYGGMKFFDRKEIKDLIAYLRVFENPLDEIALRRIINVPRRGIGATSLQYAEEIAAKEKQPIFNILLTADRYPALSRSANKMMSFAIHFSEVMMRKDDMAISEFVEYILEEMGLLAEYRLEDTVEAQSRLENLKEFISVAKEYEADQRESAEGELTFSGFLESVALSSDLDGKAEDDNCVTLMTIHNAKGLEFPVVFVVGMEEGMFPSYRSAETYDGLDEERRLCYVAITRAQQKLYLTNAGTRMLYGQTTRNIPSRFLKEIPDELLSSAGGRQKGTNTEKKVISLTQRDSVGGSGFRRSSSDFAPFGRVVHNVADVNSYIRKTQISSPEEYQVGQRVFHKKFGEGTIAKIEGTAGDAKIEIQFDNVGMKRLMLAYANLKILKES